MKKVEILTGTSIKGVPVNKGDVIEVDDSDFRLLTSYKLAKLYEPPTPEVIKDEQYKKMTIPDILIRLTELEVELPKKAKKAELIELLKTKESEVKENENN